MDALMIILLLIILFIAAVWLYIARQGDAEFVFLVEEHTPWIVEDLDDRSVTFTAKVPFINKGRQGGTIMDAYTRHLLPCEQYDAVTVQSQLTSEAMFRTDGYWESVIFTPNEGGRAIVTVKLTAKEGTIQAAMTDMVNMPVEIVYQIVARSDWYITKNRLLFVAEEAREALKNKLAAVQGE
ncbi:MAG: hypothetical protein E6713_04770 [Sporomusaceae bacterium]|nr:hypothetical protein [Sporomusaceae bacterium]